MLCYIPLYYFFSTHTLHIHLYILLFPPLVVIPSLFFTRLDNFTLGVPTSTLAPFLSLHVSHHLIISYTRPTPYSLNNPTRKRHQETFLQQERSSFVHTCRLLSLIRFAPFPSPTYPTHIGRRRPCGPFVLARCMCGVSNSVPGVDYRWSSLLPPKSRVLDDDGSSAKTWNPTK